MSYKLAIMTPEGRCFDGNVESLVAPGLAGSFGVLANHAPMVAGLQAGIVRVSVAEGDTQFFAISGGIVEVKTDGVTVLADTADKSVNPSDAERKLDVLRAASPAQ